MAALSVTTPSRSGTANPGAAVAASDTVARGIMGSLGAILEIINGNASTDNVTISDASVTSTGGPAAAIAPAIPTAQNRVFTLRPDQCDPITGNITITNSVTATVTYKLYPVG